MKIKIFYILFLLVPLAVLSQNKEREVLRGHIIADSLRVGDIVIKNATSGRQTNSDDKGYFIIMARKGDTIQFNSITYRPQQLVLTDALLHENPLTLKMDINVKVLDEVIITPLTGDLGYDATHTKIRALNPNVKPEELTYPYPIAHNNPLVHYNMESQLQGVDFVQVFRMFVKKKKSKEDRGEIYDVDNKKNFTSVVTTRFSTYFFTESLNIPQDQIGRFLAFCDKGKETAPLLDPRKEFELTDYLVKKAAEYLKK